MLTLSILRRKGLSFFKNPSTRKQQSIIKKNMEPKGFQTSFTRKYTVDIPDDATPEEKAKKLEELKREIEAKWENRAIAKPYLNDVVKIELLANETAEKIESIWKDYHKSKYCVAAVIPRDLYLSLKARVDLYPRFVIPLPRSDGGVEFFYWEQKDNMWLYTPLAEFQKKGTSAEPALTVAYYLELMNAKKLVLMRGEINPACVDILESQFLLNNTQIFFLDDLKYEVVRKFHESPDTFDYNLLLEDITIPKKKE